MLIYRSATGGIPLKLCEEAVSGRISMVYVSLLLLGVLFATEVTFNTKQKQRRCISTAQQVATAVLRSIEFINHAVCCFCHYFDC